MKSKKIVSLLMACGMVLSLLTGCGEKAIDDQKEQSSSPVSESQESKESEAAEENAEEDGVVFPLEDPVTMSIFVIANIDAAWEDTVAAQKLAEMTNVQWEVTQVMHSEATEKLNVLLNSGEYPDVIVNTGATFSQVDLDKYGAEGIFIPLQDLMKEYSPNYCALAEQRNVWEYTTSANGNVYSYAHVNCKGIDMANATLKINKDWLANVGMNVPTTTEELYEVLKAFKEQDADGDGDPNNEIPYMTCNNELEKWAGFMGIQIGGDMSVAITEDESDVYFYPASDRWKETLAFLAKLYDEGLMNNDFATLDTEQMQALGKSTASIGLTAGVLTWTVGSTAEGGKAYQYTPIKYLDGAKQKVSDNITRGGLIITDACEYPEIVAAWIDWLYTEEGGMVACLGEEGVSYTLTEDGAMWQPKTDGPYDNRVKAMFGLGIPGPYWTVDFYEEGWYVDKEVTPFVATQNAVRDEILASGDTYVFPTISYTDEEISKLSVIATDMGAYTSSYATKAITGAIDLDATWEDYLNELNKMGLKDFEQIIDEAYARVK